ncbi:hypothetical protein DPMN_036382 [Dreissena polymorpha]|uniref:Uncharacterized protein n=1 Tax=Dreissena polymorpha TaxID=45954 RepID=A0A9D4M9C0_DREPO|nr:hypothetical protein DPMN_036382 [Dreissena polymorpha]
MMDVPNIVSEKVNKTATPTLFTLLDSRNLGHILQNRNHAFDSPTRLGKRQRKSKRSDISRRHEVARGCLPIRSHHKCDESKILPTTRLGITLEDTMKV